MKIDGRRLWKASKPMLVITGIGLTFVGLLCLSPLLWVVVVGVTCVGLCVWIDYENTK